MQVRCNRGQVEGVENMIHLTIQSVEVSVPEGTSVLEAARIAGVNIRI